MVGDSGSDDVIEIYGDESYPRGGWDVLASLWLTAAGSAELRAELRRIRRNHGDFDGEIKWNKASGSQAHAAYFEVLDAGIDVVRRGKGEFRVLVIERALTRDHIWGGRSREVGLFRGWEFLLGEFVHPGVRHFVYLDSRILGNRLQLRETRLAVNRRFSHLLPAVAPPVAGILMRQSDSDDLLQLVDLFAGAIGYHVAGQHRLPGASPGKVALAGAICRHLGRSDLGAPSCQSPVRVVRIRRAASQITGTSVPMLVIDIEGLTEARQTHVLAVDEIIASVA